MNFSTNQQKMWVSKKDEWTQNCRSAEIRRDLGSPLSLIPCLEQGDLEQDAQNDVQPLSEHFQEGRRHSVSRQVVPLLHC